MSNTSGLTETEGTATCSDTEARPDAVRRSKQARKGKRQAGPQQVLYIQMEFCPRTLRSVLDSGPVEEAEAWQVRKGLSYGEKRKNPSEVIVLLEAN